jgi:hypothetical protein
MLLGCIYSRKVDLSSSGQSICCILGTNRSEQTHPRLLYWQLCYSCVISSLRRNKWDKLFVFSYQTV